jgi:hypothetical protein
MAAVATPAKAQFGGAVLGGAYVPASDFYRLRQAGEELRIQREATVALGANLEYAPFRLSLAYATGATLSEEGVQGAADLGDGTVLAAAVGVALRPLPRLLAQPYVIGGVGLKRETFSFDEVGAGSPLPRDQSEVALQIGIGADLMLGGVGLVLEITDYISRSNGSLGQHDAFVMLGARFRL